MKKLYLLGVTVAAAAFYAVFTTPSLIKNEATIVSCLWDLARPPHSASSDFYFARRQWMADLQSVRAALVYLWETAREPQPPAPPGAAPTSLLTQAGGSSNAPAVHPPSTDAT